MTEDGIAELEVGQRFAGRYVVEGLLGRGGMGAVYKVRDEALGESVALKILSLDVAGSGDALERFRREVRLSRKVTHPNVARTHDLGEHEGTHYLTMEIVVGRDLAEILDESAPLPLERACGIGRSIAEGLAAAHEAGVIHRDLKPQNVLVDMGGHVRITDFGIARPVKSDDALKTQGIVGTPAYMAPEQVRGGAIDERTDVYALGLVLYEMVTGQRAFNGTTPIATAIARLERDAVDPRRLSPIPDALAELILSCLARDPEARPKSARAVAGALAALTPSTSPKVSPSPSRAVGTDATMIASTGSVTMLRGEPRLAILPFTYRGPEEHAYLGDTFADELIDALCRTRGLAVLASGATAGYRDKRDPRVVGRELDVDAVVDGTVQSAGPRVRVSARLSDAKTGVQLASEKCEGEITDVFDLQDTLTRRVAEALRVSITTAAQGVAAPAEAVELYLRGRKQLRDFEYSGETGAVSLLRKALDLAPELAPAAAAYAIACVRAWFIPGLEQGKDFGALARAAIARALEVAPALAETHFATALFASQEGDYTRMARELRAALRIAPAYADALESLGMLEVETGRTARGVERIELAAGLDPTLTLGHIALARHYALSRDDPHFFHYIDLLESGPHAGRLSVLHLLFRRAGWRRDLDAMRAVEARLPAGDGAPQRMGHLHADVVLGRASGTSVVERVREILALDQSPRFRVFSGQLACEICGIAGEVEEGIAQLDVVSRMALVDLAWIERCPALDSLRSHPEFERARARVLKRVDEIWTE